MATKTSSAKTDVKQAMSQLDTILNEYLVKKAPVLPQNLKEVLVKFAPYLTILSVVVSVPSLLSMLGLSASVTKDLYWAMVGFTGYNFYLAIAFSLVIVALQALAVPGLLARKLQGWTMLYYAVLVNAVSMLMGMNLVSFVVWTGLSLYVLFQVRSMYR